MLATRACDAHATSGCGRVAARGTRRQAAPSGVWDDGLELCVAPACRDECASTWGRMGEYSARPTCAQTDRSAEESPKNLVATSLRKYVEVVKCVATKRGAPRSRFEFRSRQRERRIRGPVTVVLLALVGFPAGWATAGPGQSGQEFVTRVDALYVQVFPAEGDLGRWGGLTRDDFVVRIGGEEHSVIGAYPVDARELGRLGTASWMGGDGLLGTSEPAVSIPPVARRRFLVFLDVARATRAGIRNARRSALEFVKDHVVATDYLGLTVYSARRGLEHVVPLTTNHTLLLEALSEVDSARAAERYAPVADGIPLEAFAKLAAEQSADPVLDKLVPTREEFVRQIEEARVEVEAATMLGALHAVFRDLQGAGGPTHVMLFSRGLPDGVLADAEARFQLERVVAEAEAAGVLVHAFQPDNLPGSNVHDPEFMQSRWQPGYDPGLAGLPPWFVLRDRAILQFLAAETGGLATFYQHALSGGLADLDDLSSRYYVLGIQLTGNERAAAPIEVRVRNPDVAVTWSPRRLLIKQEQPLTENARAIQVAEALDMGAEASQLPVRYVAVPFPTEAGGTLKVWLGMDVSAIGDLVPEADTGLLAFEFLGLVANRAGGVVDHFRARARLKTGGDVALAVVSEPLRYFDELQVGTGDYFVKLLVREASTGQLFSKSLMFTIPTPDGGLGVVGPLIVQRIGVPGDGDGAQAGAQRVSVDGIGILPEAEPKRGTGEELELFAQVSGVMRDPETADFRLGLWLTLESPGLPAVEIRPEVRRRESLAGGTERFILGVQLPESVRAGAYSLVLHVADEIANAEARGWATLHVVLP